MSVIIFEFNECIEDNFLIPIINNMSSNIASKSVNRNSLYILQQWVQL